MTVRARHVLYFALAFGALTAAPAQAVIKLDLSVKKTYETSKAVITGTIGTIDTATRSFEVEGLTVLRGTSPGEKIRVQLAAPPELLQSVKAGEPIVIFQSRAPGDGMASIYLADRWVLARGAPGSNQRLWRVVQVQEDAKKMFSGKAADLVQALGELKDGKTK
jgi:hypothetical protein